MELPYCVQWILNLSSIINDYAFWYSQYKSSIHALLSFRSALKHFNFKNFSSFSVSFSLPLLQLHLSSISRFLVRFDFKCLPLSDVPLLLYTGAPLVQAIGSQLRSEASNAKLPSFSSSMRVGLVLKWVLRRYASVQTLQPAFCSARCTTFLLPTISAMNSSTFSQLSCWMS